MHMYINVYDSASDVKFLFYKSLDPTGNFFFSG